MSSVFIDGDHVVKFYKALFELLKAETNFSQMLEKAGLTIKFILTDPEVDMWLGHDKVLAGDEIDQDATAVMEGAVDTMHAVWTKKLALTKAMATKKIKVKGPTMGIMKLMPALDPIFDRYPDHCKKFGIEL